MGDWKKEEKLEVRCENKQNILFLAELATFISLRINS